MTVSDIDEIFAFHFLGKTCVPEHAPRLDGHIVVENPQISGTWCQTVCEPSCDALSTTTILWLAAGVVQHLNRRKALKEILLAVSKFTG
jgi:hypothetical protein